MNNIVFESLNDFMVYSPILEKRSHHETNVDVTFETFLSNVKKLDPTLKNTFVSFRERLYVSDINPHNKYNTPTGFYCYPLSSFGVTEGMSLSDFRELFPFASERKELIFFTLKQTKGVITESITEEEILEYVTIISKVFSNNEDVVESCTEYINGVFEFSYLTNHISHGAHKLWLFLYQIASITTSNISNIPSAFTTICNKIGITGFVDYQDNGYIHPDEPTQAVFFKVKNIGVINVYTDNYKEKITDMSGLIKKIREGIPLISIFDGVSNPDEKGRIIVAYEDKENILDKNERFISKVWFDYVKPYENGVAMVYNGVSWNYINEKGVLISPKLWFSSVNSFKNGFGSVYIEDKGHNYIDIDGNLLLSNWSSSNSVFGKHFGIVEYKNKGYFIVDDNGKILNKKGFENAEMLENGEYAIIDIEYTKSYTQYAVIDKQAKFVIRDTFDYIEDINQPNCVIVQTDNKYNLLLLSQKRLISNTWYPRVQGVTSDGNYCIVGDGEGHYNIMDMSGDLLLSEWVDDIANKIKDDEIYIQYDNEVFAFNTKTYELTTINK